MSLSPEQRSLRASTAAYTRWSGEDPRPAMKQVREGYVRKFENLVDPDKALPEGERRRRATAAMRAEMRRLALISSRVRAERRREGLVNREQVVPQGPP